MSQSTRYTIATQPRPSERHRRADGVDQSGIARQGADGCAAAAVGDERASPPERNRREPPRIDMGGDCTAKPARMDHTQHTHHEARGDKVRAADGSRDSSISRRCGTSH